MNALSTMLLIADAFVSLCDEMPLRKVSISDIVQRTGKNRKTFYYHFENKDRLIIWIFRYDMGQVLKKHFSESVLLYEKPSDDSISHFPYYITQKSGVRSLDHAEFFSCFAEVLEARRHFYREALIDNGPYSLRNYLYALYLEAMKRDMFPYLTDPDVFEVPVGSIEFVEAYLRKMYGIEKMVPLLVPIQLDIPEYLGRKDALVCSKSELRDKASEWGAEEVFLKSASQLKCDYTGVYDIRKDTLPSDKEMYISEVLNIFSEWRVFVSNERIVGVKHYLGDPWAMPDKSVVYQMVREYTDCPAAYTLDVAVAADLYSGKPSTVVIEVHPFVSCGLYGFEGKELPKMLIQGFRWVTEFLSTEAI